MKKQCYFLTVASLLVLLFIVAKTSIAFQCIGPAENNCLQCHSQTEIDDIHKIALGSLSNCKLCHCGGNCEPSKLSNLGSLDTVCCTSCHNQCFLVKEHTTRGSFDCTSCHISPIAPVGIDDDCDGICNPEETAQICSGSDNCPSIYNPDQKDSNSDGVGDACSVCSLEKIYGKDSKEVEIFLYTRDNVLSQNHVGQELIKLYYQWNPAVVKLMDADARFQEDVKKMIDGILILIVDEAE